MFTIQPNTRGTMVRLAFAAGMSSHTSKPHVPAISKSNASNPAVSTSQLNRINAVGVSHARAITARSKSKRRQAQHMH